MNSILKTVTEVEDWFYGSNRPDILSFDWETTGLDYLTMEPVGISFCDGQDALYIDLWENPNASDIFNVLGSIFSRGLFIAHNAKYDINCCKRFLGQTPTKLFCTLTASFLLNENRGSHKLKHLAQYELKVPKTQISAWEKADNMGRHSEFFYKYALNDSIWTYELYRRFKPRLTEENLDHVFYNIEMPFIPVLADMEIRGIKIDPDKLTDLGIRVKNKLIELEDRMLNSVGMLVMKQGQLFCAESERILPVNLNSSDQLVKIIEKKCGLKVTERTPKEQKKAVTKETLSRLKGKHPFIDYLIDYKAFRKLYDAYIVPASDWIGPDNRFRPNWGIVKTGRTSCSKPNLQQLPNLRKYPDYSYRSIFIPEEGEFLVGGDYSGQELRVLAEITQDDTLLHSFNNNVDLHLFTANSIFDLKLREESFREGTQEYKEAVERYELERYKAKNGANFPIVYGTSKYGIAHRMGVSAKEAQTWIDGFFRLYPKVKGSIEETKKELEENLEVCTLMGRKRRFPDYNILPEYAKGKNPCKSRCLRQAFNFKIQGFSADQIKIAARLAWEQGLKIIMIIHDEIVIETSKPERDIKILESCMKNAVLLSVPFEVEIKSGKSYKEIK